jgi:2-polyprenyl-3-methyl-5-hydroxy-6-metoxy-1,4-benzoquinol methylase
LCNKTKIFCKPLNLLHVAPELNLKNILKNQTNINYVTADLLSDNVLIKLDISKSPLHNNIFDLVICNHVLEHIIDDKRAMSELYRILKPGGMAILQVPISRYLSR